MEDVIILETNKLDLLINKKNISNKELSKKEKIYSKIYNIKVKNKSNINKLNNYFINILIYSNLKPKNKSEQYKLNSNLT